jgi:hypothetical protein
MIGGNMCVGKTGCCKRNLLSQKNIFCIFTNLD